MKILITGIGCIGKSTIRKKIASDFPNKVTTIDMDYDYNIPNTQNKIIVIESVHGLEHKPQTYDKILYLLPPKNHLLLWLKRGTIWFKTGIIDLSKPKGKRKPNAISNIPIITKILARDILLSKKWVKSDLTHIEQKLRNKTYIASSVEEGHRTVTKWITSYSKVVENHENLYN